MLRTKRLGVAALKLFRAKGLSKVWQTLNQLFGLGELGEDHCSLPSLRDFNIRINKR